jgi:hypothetical protein
MVTSSKLLIKFSKSLRLSKDKQTKWLCCTLAVNKRSMKASSVLMASDLL